MATGIVQLDLNQNVWVFKARSLLGLADRLLAGISDTLPESKAIPTAEFRNRVTQWRRTLQLEDDADSLSALVREIAGECLSLLEQVRRDRTDRDAEVADLAAVVQDVLSTLKGHSRTFEAEFARSTSNMEQLVALQDIRELKRQLTREVSQLRESAKRRQQADEKRYEQLTSRVQALEISLQQAQIEAATDALTGVFNRGAFEMTARTWLARGGPSTKGFALALADLDDFKVVNDRHGHQVGDRVLVAAAVHLRTCLREGDLLFRYGGEEFAVLFASGTAEGARERLVATLEAIAPAYECDCGDRSVRVSFTFSAGVTASTDGDSYDTLVGRADEALYEAKRRGKRRVEIRQRSRLISFWR